MGNKTTSLKSKNSSNRLLFQIDSEPPSFNFQPKIIQKEDPFHKNVNNGYNKSPQNVTPRGISKQGNIKIDLQEIKATYNFINRTLLGNYIKEVNINVVNNAMITCDYRFLCEYEEERRSKTVHFPDDDKFSIQILKKIQKFENKHLNDSIKTLQKHMTSKEKEEPPLMILEGVNLDEFKVKTPVLRGKTEKPKIKNKQVENILTNNFMTPRYQKQGHNFPTTTNKNSNNNNPSIQKHTRTNSKKKADLERPQGLKSKIEEKISKQTPNPNKRQENHYKKPSQTQRDLKPAIEQTTSQIIQRPKKELSKRNLQLDLSNATMSHKQQEFHPMSSKSFHESNKLRTPLFQQRKNNNPSSRNSSVRSKEKENQPPMKSILKQKKPKFLITGHEEDSDQERKTNRDSFHTICMTELNESRASKSMKSQNFSSQSSSEEEEQLEVKKGPKNAFNPVKIHLKLDDLLNSGRGIQQQNLNLSSKAVHLKNKSPNLKKNEYATTTDTSKEDQTKLNLLRVIQKNEKKKNKKNESSSSSSMNEYHKIEEIVLCNVDLQKNKVGQPQKKKKKPSEASSQFNHISEEASEFFREGELD